MKTSLGTALSLLAALLLAVMSPAQEGADRGQQPQEPTAAEAQAQQEALQRAEAFTVPEDLAAALEVDPEDMQEALAPAPVAKLEAVLADWMALIQSRQRDYQAAISAEEGSDERSRADAIGTDRDTLIARAEAVIELVAQKGGEVGAARDTIQGIREAETAQAVDDSTVPQDQTKAQSVDLEVLRAQLRPLTVGQVEKQLVEWMALLQKKCFEVRKAEVAGLRAETGDEIAKFNATAVELRADRDALIGRVKVVVDAFADKHGDEAKVAEHRAYLSSIVATPPIGGFRAAWTTFTSWLVNADGGVALGLNIAGFLLILLVFRLGGALVSRLLDRTLRAVGRTPTLLRDFFVNMARKLTMLIGLVVALGHVGVDIGPLVAAIGGAAFVIGFALQGTLSNFAAGLMILMYRPYNVGDVVEIGGTNGTVHSQNLVSTTIKTFDNKTVIVPNNTIWGDVITNATASSTRRVDMTFGIGYGDDIAKAEGILRDVVTSHDKVLADPAPVIHVHELGDSSVNFIVRPWVRTPDYWAVYWSITRQVKERFDREGVSIPFPQRDVHVYHEALPAPDKDALLPRPEGSPAQQQDRPQDRRQDLPQDRPAGAPRT